MSKVKWAIGGAVLVGAAVFGALRLSAGGDAAAKQAGPMTAPVERRTIEIVAEAAGTLEPIRLVEVKSKASGEVQSVEVETGMQVEEGTLLAKIDPRDVENAYQQAVADLESARVRARTARAQRQRLETLKDAGVVTLQELETAIEADATARAALVRAETNLQLAKERREDATIRAPITGTIIERTAEPGLIIASATSNVSGGTTLFKMADLSVMQVRARVDETDIGRIQPGQKVSVSVEAFPNRVFRGEVQKIEPQSVVEQNVTMFPVLVRLDNGEGLLRPGMNAEVTIEIARRRDVAAIPNGAIVSMRDARTVAAALEVPEAELDALLEGARRGRSGRSAGGGGPAIEPARASAPQGSESPAGVGPGGGRDPGGEHNGGAAEGRPGVVFVMSDGRASARRVRLGLSDWDYTEVVSGLEPGEQVVLASAVQLEQRQQQLQDRMRSRMGGPLPGAGGGRGGGRGR